MRALFNTQRQCVRCDRLPGSNQARYEWSRGQPPAGQGGMTGMRLMGLAVALGCVSLPLMPGEDTARRHGMAVGATGLPGSLPRLASGWVDVLM